MVVLNNVLPVFALIALGWLLGRTGLTEPDFYKTADRLIYYIFLPGLLFWKTAAPAAPPTFDPAWIIAVCGVIVAAHLLCLIWARLTAMPADKVGSFCQGAYRFNTYVGMAVVLSVFGEAGVSRFSVLVGFAIPLINILAVSALIWYSSRSYTGLEKIILVVKSIVTNPLVIACAAGLSWYHLGFRLPVFINNSLRLLSLVALPLALLSIGAGLTFNKLGRHPSITAAAVVFKLGLMPLGGWLALKWAGSSGLDFSTAMIFFALPTSTASYILSAQLGADPDLAKAEIVLSTVLSIISLSVVSALFPV